jgi:hypothetical protein
MPAQQCLESPGPFVNGVLDINDRIAGLVGVSAVEHLGAAVVERYEILFREIAVADAIKMLPAGRDLLWRLKGNRIEVRVTCRTTSARA